MRFYHRTKNLFVKTSRNKDKYNIVWIVLLILFSLFLLYCNIRPQDTGVLGKFISKLMSQLFGITRFVVPILLLYWIWYILKSKTKQFKLDILLSVILLVLLCGVTKVFLNILHLPAYQVSTLSGYCGNLVFEIAERIFGTVFGSIIIIFLFVYLITVLFEVSLIELISVWSQKIYEDVVEWYKEIKTKKKEEVLQQTLVSRYVKQRSEKQLQEIVKPFSNSLVQESLKKEVKEIILTQPEKHKIETEQIVAEKEKVKKSVQEEQKIVAKKYVLPNTQILSLYQKEEPDYSYIEQQGRNLENVLKQFDIEAKVVNISVGPVVTMYELELEPGVKVQSVSALRDNIALAMKSTSIRIIAPLPSKGTIGIEIPNQKPQIVSIREVLESKEYKELTKDMKLPIILGKTTDGKVYVDDIVTMPHMLIAGATGSGKSVCIHSIITSLLFRCSPDYLKLVLIDPKRLELTRYNGIPHLYNPNCGPKEVKVITDPKEATKVLSSLVKVMEQRYEKFAAACVRNIDGYNELMLSRGQPQEFYIVVIIDEFADLILTASKEVEEVLQRLAQMARAVGIHLVLATQRPSVDVITGVIKANFTCRIAFQVLSKTDSRIILDTAGAEELIGRGDMLYLPTGAAKPIRLQGAFVSEKDIDNLVNFIKSQNIEPSYEPIVKPSLPHKVIHEKETEQEENLYAALLLIKERRRVSQDLLKAYFRSSAKATDILSLLEVKGYIYKPEGTNRWSINFDRVEEGIKSYEEKIGKVSKEENVEH
jgi:S-DNA-T family DNA segregation ATPase FtsK/SpoIIIE